MLNTHKRRRRTMRRRVGWYRGLAGELLCVCLGGRHRVRGSDVAGYRTVRILRAKVDRIRRVVVLVVVRLCGGDAARNAGFNGPIVTLDDRDEFVGGMCRGIVREKRLVAIDGVYAAAVSPGRRRSQGRDKGGRP